MDNSRCRTPMTVDHYLGIQGRIVSREEGVARNYLRANYTIVQGEFVKKNTADMIGSKKTPFVVASKDPQEDKQEYLNYLCTNLGFIQESTKTFRGSDVVPTSFNAIQSFLMNCNNPFLWVNKTRQFGFSFVLACRALAKSMLKKRHTSIFVSYNEEESKEKIVYAKELYESMPMKWKLARRLKYDNKTSLVFEKSGSDAFETRIISYPQREVRGKGGELDIVIDEAAHCIHLRNIFKSAMPALLRGTNSSLWVGSSPKGKGGLHYEIGTNQDNKFPDFLRITVPWWVIPEFCLNVQAAMKEAWDMHTDERVAKFGNKQIKMIRNNMDLDEFRQEHECEYLDEHYSYFPWDLISACVPIFNVAAENAPTYDASVQDLKNDKTKAGVGVDFYRSTYPDLSAFDDFIFAINSGQLQGHFVGGFDVGRTEDASEIVYIEEDEKSGHQIVRCNITMKNVPLPVQQRVVAEQFEKLGGKLIKFGVDYNGLGRQIYEGLLESSYNLVEKLDFNNGAWKEEACRRLKLRMEKTAISFPTHKPMQQQIHSVKRILLPSGAWRFDTEKNSKHHADKMWAILGASEMGRPVVEGMSNVISFDKRIIELRNMRQKPEGTMQLYNPNKIMETLKFTPWGNTMPALPMGTPNLSNFGASMLPFSGTTELDLTRR